MNSSIWFGATLIDAMQATPQLNPLINPPPVRRTFAEWEAIIPKVVPAAEEITEAEYRHDLARSQAGARGWGWGCGCNRCCGINQR